jgi:folate-binding protein YgfZ
LLAISGPDASSFAQAQFTSDVNTLAPGHWQWSAWLDAQGRVRHFFALLRTGPEHLLVWLPLGDAQAMREALVRYVFRARVVLTAMPHWDLRALSEDELGAAIDDREIVPHAGGYAIRQPGARIALLAPSDTTAADADALHRWRAADVAATLPLVAPALSGEFVPQALGLERLDAIRFDKGCYPGQEIAARLHFRGGNKRALHRLRVEGDPLADGEEILGADGALAGRILYCAATAPGAAVALAVLSIETPRDALMRTMSGAAVFLSDV